MSISVLGLFLETEGYEEDGAWRWCMLSATSAWSDGNGQVISQTGNTSTDARGKSPAYSSSSVRATSVSLKSAVPFLADAKSKTASPLYHDGRGGGGEYC